LTRFLAEPILRAARRRGWWSLCSWPAI